MRVVIIGMGRQGQKRVEALKAAGDQAITVDPIVKADYPSLQQVPKNFDAAIICTPNDVKNKLISSLLLGGKHVLIEKPVLATREEFRIWEGMARGNKCVFHVGYNHRHEPSIVRLGEILQTERLGPIYHARMFYGNGTCADIKGSWKDTGGGVIPEVGSHLLDLLRLWFPIDWELHLMNAGRRENAAPERALVLAESAMTAVTADLEMSWWSWKNTFTVDIWGEKGSAHLNGFRKWLGSELTVYNRVLPSGLPEEIYHVRDNGFDRTWEHEWDYFSLCCRSGRAYTDFDHQIWLARQIKELSERAVELCR